MTKIVFDARSATTTRISGWERYTRALLSIAARMPDVSILAPAADGARRRLASDLGLALRRFDRRSVLHFPATPPPAWVRQRSIVTIHDLTWWRYPETASRLGITYYRRFADFHCHRGGNLIATVSEAVANELRDRYPRQPVCVIPNIVSIDRVTPEPAPISLERPYFLTVASVEPRKNLDRLIRAFETSDAHKDFDLVLVGRKAWGSVPNGSIRYTGVVSDGELAGMYRGAHGVISPSLYEGFGLAVAEARSVGTPVACSSIPAHREAADNASIWFDPVDIESIANSLDQLATRSHLTANNPYDQGRALEAMRKAYERLEN